MVATWKKKKKWQTVTYFISFVIDALTLSATTTEKKPIAKSDKKITKARKKQKKRVKKSTPVKNVNKKVKPMKAPRKYKAIGRTITQGDKSYELMFDMLLGIRISVSGVSAKKKNEITRNDISEVSNYFMPRYIFIYLFFFFLFIKQRSY